MAATDPVAIVEALDALILTSATRGFPLSYTISGRTLTFQSLDAIMKLRKEYAAMAADQVLAGKRSRARLLGGPPA